VSRNKSRLTENIKSGKKIKSHSPSKNNAVTPAIDIRNTDEFKSLKRRRRLIYLLFLLGAASAVYYNKNSIKPYVDPYWQQYALPLLHQYLPTELKQKIGLEEIQLKSEEKSVAAIPEIKKEKLLQKPAVLFNVNNFIINRQGVGIQNNEIIKIVSESEFIELRQNLNEQPENADKLIFYYKYLLGKNSNDATARQGISKLRHWFIMQLRDSVANDDIGKGELLLNILKTNFPQVVNKPKFQKFENILLRKESVNTHLRLAEEYFNKEQFIEPESENALDELIAIFSVDPENLKAKILQRKMLDVFVDQVKNYQAAKQYESAIISAQSGLKVSANDAFLKSSYKNLQKLYKVQQQVDNYLLLAKKQMDKGNYVTPINNNALK